MEAVADLVIIAFFYLLRVGEYTTASNKKAKRTIALRDCDVRLWGKGQMIPHSAGRARLLTADSATICIAHTKNGTKGVKRPERWHRAEGLSLLTPTGWVTIG